MKRDRSWNRHQKKLEEAAISILRKAAKPLDIRELTTLIIKNGLYEPRGRTPEKSLYSIIWTANRRRLENGRPPLFIKHRDSSKGIVRYTL
jgi:hypothetical protein